MRRFRRFQRWVAPWISKLQMTLAAGAREVAQVSNLLYRRFPIGWGSDLSKVMVASRRSQAGSAATQQIGNLRYRTAPPTALEWSRVAALIQLGLERKLSFFLLQTFLFACSIHLTPAIAQEASPEKTGLAVGRKAPAFTLKDQNDKEVSLASLLKKGPVALVFYRSADW